MAVCGAAATRFAMDSKLSNQEDAETDSDVGEDITPTTTVSEDSNDTCTDSEVAEGGSRQDSLDSSEASAPQLGPGLYHDDVEDLTPAQQGKCDLRDQDCDAASQSTEGPRDRCDSSSSSSTPGSPEVMKFSKEETLFVFDWDDTILPSSWVSGQGLRLDDSTKVNDLQRAQLSRVAPYVAETLRLAKLYGTVVLVTNAERGWIELSCRKFLPTVSPLLENVRMVSARTSYEGPGARTPLDWKLHAFEAELERHFGADVLEDASVAKNIFSLGDGAHEREALLRSTRGLPNCCSKSLKFVERPDLTEITKQHALITSCFETILHHNANLDLCIRC